MSAPSTVKSKITDLLLFILVAISNLSLSLSNQVAGHCNEIK